MSDYLYVPDDDSEFGPVWSTMEAREVFTVEELASAQPAELVISLDGARGHYLAAGYLDNVADLLDNVTTHVTPVRPGMVHAAKVEEWRKAAAAYESHQGLFSDDSCQASPVGDYDSDSGMCSACEYIHEIADEAESILSDLGYVTIWNDGVQVFRVEGGES